MKHSIKAIVQGQEQAKVNNFNTDLFVTDRSPIESLDMSAYSLFAPVSSDHQHDRGEHDKLVEGAIGIIDNEFYFITATTSSFNGETQISYTEQEITLKGLNYFTKDADIDLTEVYNNHLLDKGYEISIDDIKQMGELNTEYNCTTLKFKAEDESMHYLTVNSKDQLSGITVRSSSKKVTKAQNSSIPSAFGQTA